MKRVIIAGSRLPKPDSGITPITYEVVEHVMAGIYHSGYEHIFYDIGEIVSGRASGVDSLGEQWAIKHGKAIKPFPADWNAHGKAAGPIRNRLMAQYADAAVVIINIAQESKGSQNMIEEMVRVNKPVAVMEVNMSVPDFTVSGYIIMPGAIDTPLLT